MAKFLIQNFGCRATQADGAAIQGMLTERGMAPTSEVEEAEWVILNTCTVTSAADEDARRAVRRVLRRNPEARVLVTGCYAQRAPAELAGLPGVSWVVGNSHKGQIADILAETGDTPYHGEIRVRDIFEQRELHTCPVTAVAGDRTRPNLKIQDGCGNRCSFCVIPFVRGRSRSAPPDEVVARVRVLAERHREIVLSGINLGRWGREPGIRMRLADLVRRLLAETPIERLRLSSVEPMDLANDLLALMASSSRMAEHVHAPLQSGCDSVLRRMRRRYRPRHYSDRIRKAHEWMPDAAIGADVMVGFPGETDEEFEENRRFIENHPFTYLHVFTYSARPGTEAINLPGQVPKPVRKERNRILRELAAAKNLEFRRRMVGRKLSVVTLSREREAISDNYIQVELAQPRPENQLLEIEVGAVTDKGVRESSSLPALA